MIASASSRLPTAWSRRCRRGAARTRCGARCISSNASKPPGGTSLQSAFRSFFGARAHARAGGRDLRFPGPRGLRAELPGDPRSSATTCSPCTSPARKSSIRRSPTKCCWSTPRSAAPPSVRVTPDLVQGLSRDLPALLRARSKAFCRTHGWGYLRTPTHDAVRGTDAQGLARGRPVAMNPLALLGNRGVGRSPCRAWRWYSCCICSSRHRARFWSPPA